MTEYWKWPESSWTSQEIDWKQAKVITAGVDVGTTSSQAVVMCDGQLFSSANLRNGPDFKVNAQQVIEQALGQSGMQLKDIRYTVGTGFGSPNISYARKTVNEINCHARGGQFMFGPSVRTIVDLGAQTTKAIRVYGWDRVRDFMLNDKCATGMGRAIEVMADLLQVPVAEMGDKSLDIKEQPEPVSTTCYAFANTEAMGLFREGYTENQVLATYLFGLEYRIYGMVGRIKPEKEIAFTGGLAKNSGITRRLEKDLAMTALTSPYDPQLAGAIGAALIAKTIVENSRQAAAVKI